MRGEGKPNCFLSTCALSDAVSARSAKPLLVGSTPTGRSKERVVFKGTTRDENLLSAKPLAVAKLHAWKKANGNKHGEICKVEKQTMFVA